jgi:hypothetical protein
MSTESQLKYKDIDDYMKQEGIPLGMRDTLQIIYLQNPPAPWEEAKPNIKKPQTGKTDQEGVLILNPTKEGGKEFYTKQYKYKRSKHGQASKPELGKIPRDTFWLENVPFMQGEYTFIGKIDFEGDDDFSFKVGSKDHSKSDKKAGQCYSFGISSKGEVHLSKETPGHPTTPNFDEKCKLAAGMPRNIGPISNKIFGCKGVLYFVNSGKDVYIECWVNLKPLNENKTPNNEGWKLWWTALDKGDWKNKAQTFFAKGNNQTLFHRIDHVGDKTEMYFGSAREILVPNQ